jgi:hypothetical protein
MFRIAALSTFLLLALAPSALADGGTLGAMQGWTGVTTLSGQLRYVTFGTGIGSTPLAAISTRDGRVFQYATLPGDWGIPQVTQGGTAAGLFRRGSTLVLADASLQRTPLRRWTRFAFVNTKNLAVRGTIALRGDFAFDALSPGGTSLFLIQHVSQSDFSRYLVRVYDLQRNRLLAGAIADRSQRGWVMRGYPVSRTASTDGRWVYTLYQRDTNYPFIHALDTMRRTAICIGLPLPFSGPRSAQNDKLRLADHGTRLLVVDPQGKQTRLIVDTATFRISRPGPAGGTSSFMLGGAIGGGVLLVLGAGMIRRRLQR